jgi:hypothetical protein
MGLLSKTILLLLLLYMSAIRYEIFSEGFFFSKKRKRKRKSDENLVTLSNSDDYACQHT